MEDLLYEIFLGWPSAVLGLCALTAGSVSGRVSISTIGAMSATGFCLYVSMYVFPFSLLLLLVLITNWICVFYVSKGKRAVAMAFVSPLAIECLALGYLVFAQ